MQQITPKEQKRLDKLMKKEIKGLSLCPSCYCMTKTIKNTCGKCGAIKLSPEQEETIISGVQKVFNNYGEELRMMGEEERFIGVSQWREVGKKYHHWQYFEKEVRDDALTCQSCGSKNKSMTVCSHCVPNPSFSKAECDRLIQKEKRCYKCGTEGRNDNVLCFVCENCIEDRELKIKEKIKADLLAIAERGEIEDLRREVEHYFSNK